MMLLLDRQFQREALEKAANAYPDRLNWHGNFDFDRKSSINIIYLTEHKLVESEWHGASAVGIKPMWVKITAKGLDFLQDDGGLTAILGVVTVRLHDDELKRLLIEKIHSTQADDTVKRKLVETVKSLPSVALGNIVDRLIDTGISSLSDGVDSIVKLINS